VVIGLIAVTAAGRTAAARLAASWPGETRAYDGPAAQALPRAWSECEDGLVCFLAAGAVIRLVAPLLESKATDPAVVCVDEAARFAVPLVGGHAGGANALAVRVADVLGAQPVITTASDAAGLPGLDDLGWPAEGAVAAVTRALLDGGTVILDSDETWPLPALPITRAEISAQQAECAFGHALADPNAHLAPTPGAQERGESQGLAAGPDRYRILVTDRVVTADARTVVLRPPSLVVGVGASRNVSRAEVLGLIDDTLAEAGLSLASVTALATVDAKGAEPGLVAAAGERGWRLLSYPPARLAAIPVPNPGAAALAAVGTPSVAEAAALASADVLAVEKRKSAMATVAIGRIRPRGRLAVVGLGPGARDLLAPRAVAELRRASVIVGLGQYVDQVRDLLRPGTEVLASELGAEEERAKAAVTLARAGHAVALVGSGDAGVYAMASPALLQADGGMTDGDTAPGAGGDIEVVVVPGITASLAAAALLGAPLGHDHAVISLSDLHTPWEVIERRVRAAAEADYVTVFYNPRSKGRHWQLGAALAVLAAHRPPGTPAAIVRNAARTGQRVVLTTVAAFDPEAVDMLSLVIVGASTTRMVGGRMVTPRGYAWQPW
jgi:cobalt-precorrin 5A hydrolase / precorrin-3B C17-methyltransferase